MQRIFPEGTSDVSRLCSPYRRILGTISSLRRIRLYLSSADVSSNDAALLKMMSLADSAVWSGSSSLMNRSSAKPLHDPSTFDPLSAVKGADNIMDGGVWWVIFPAFQGLVEGPRGNAWRLRRPHEQTVFHHERDFSTVPLQKTTPFRNLCAIQRSPLNICSFASSIVSLFVHEKALLISVSEVRWNFPREVKCHASLCEHCSLSPSSAKEAVPVWREVFISSFTERVSHHCSEKSFPPRAQNVDDTCDHHSFLSITFVDQDAV